MRVFGLHTKFDDGILLGKAVARRLGSLGADDGVSGAGNKGAWDIRIGMDA